MKLFRRSPSEELSGFLDVGTSFTGEMHFSGTLRLDGNVHGSITTADVLVIGEKATVHADIKAGEVEIHGTVFGNVDSERRIQIYAGGRLCGDVNTPKLVIEDGGRFEGQSRGGSGVEAHQLQPEPATSTD